MIEAHILVVDDELSMREYLEVLLARAGYRVTSASTAQEAKALLAREPIDLIVSDMRLGSGSGLEVLAAARLLRNAPEVILITAFGTPASAVEAMRAGAYDYISKPFDNEELLLLVQKALEKLSLREENRALRSRVPPAPGLVLGNSPRMRELFSIVEKVASARTTVLITGESGTGKELVARAIHLSGRRADQPFVPVNCAALNEGVLESELFGHVKGAFTGATSDRSGILVSAGEGTVLLDEVGEMPLALQVKLLRVLQERQVKPVGTSLETPFRARIIAATHRRLEDEVKAGRFREDLLYRLNVITLELPPLRERSGDVVEMAETFLARMREELGRSRLQFAPATLELLRNWSWPGNVRQLQNVVERAATLADGDMLEPESLPASLRGLPSSPKDQALPDIEPGFSLEKFLDLTEERYLEAALGAADGVKTRAAELLGLSFRSFRYRLAKHGFSDREDAVADGPVSGSRGD